VARDLSRGDAHEEDNLLIEAVSLLVQRQRETETWVAKQVEHAEERAGAAERRYADIEARLAGIEDQLDRLVGELGPDHGDALVDQRLARLREQVEDLKSGTDSHQLRTVSPSVEPPVQRDPEPLRPPPPPASVEPTSVSTGAPRTTLWDRFGSTAENRFGLVAIGIGALAILYGLSSAVRG
jgi:hypothetical protein